MANKTIPDLTEKTTFADAGVLAFDDGIQTFKVKSSTIRRRLLGDAVVGSGAGCTHTTLALAIADAAIVDGMTVVLTENANLAAKQTISKKLTIKGYGAITLTKTGGTQGLELDADGITIENLRFAAYTTAGNIAIITTANGTYCRVKNCRFAVSTDTDIQDTLSPAGKKISQFGNILEV